VRECGPGPSGVTSVSIVTTGTSRRGRGPTTIPHRRLVSWLVVLVPLVIVVVGAWSYRWVQEDAFINFRIIGNLLAGHGPVYNVGERVEVYSDPLWVFSVAGLHEVLPFLSIEWLSVLLGLTGTAGGVVLSGRAVQQLSSTRSDALVLPLGLVVFSVVAGVWEFATSGLEMGMVFLWVGLSFWLLVRTEQRRDSAVRCAFFVGLGTLIRPELVLMSVVYLAALAAVVSSRSWRGPTSIGHRYMWPLIAAVLLPALYELGRMAYFAMAVSNTALAKAAGSSWWTQGFTYLWNFVAPYTLWLPLALVVPITVPRLWRWWRARDRIGVIVAVAPVAAAVADMVYVVRLGGDYQHARLLLPAFLSLCAPLYIEVRQLRSLAVIPIAGIAVWSVLCGGWLRYSTGGPLRSDHGITDERSVWIYATKSAHPINAADYHSHLGAYYQRLAAAAGAEGRQVMVPATGLVTTVRNGLAGARPARSPLPFALAVNVGAIGVTGYLSGPDTYIFDEYSLANPIGAHFTIHRRGRPGQEKYIGPTWMFARFGLPTDQLPLGVSAGSVATARHVLSCAPLGSYLHAITAPLGLSQALSNISHSLTYTTMEFDSNPKVAEHQLCR
jgi:arabinofuranosyltransferase